MILITKTSDQTRQRGHALSTCTMCVCVCVVIPFVLDVRLVDAPAGVTQEEGHTGGRSHTGFLHLPFACLNFYREKDSAIPFPRRPRKRILCTHELVILHLLGVIFFFFVFFFL